MIAVKLINSTILLSFQFGVPLKPHLTNLKKRLRKFEKSKLVASQKNDAYIWNDGMFLNPKSGNVYLIKGNIKSTKIVSNSDGLYWRSGGTTRAGQKVTMYQTAIPILENEEDSQLEGNSKNCYPPMRDISYKKTLTYDRKSSIFLIEYFGDDTEYTWKRKFSESWLNLGMYP